MASRADKNPTFPRWFKNTTDHHRESYMDAHRNHNRCGWPTSGGWPCNKPRHSCPHHSPEWNLGKGCIDCGNRDPKPGHDLCDSCIIESEEEMDGDQYIIQSWVQCVECESPIRNPTPIPDLVYLDPHQGDFAGMCEGCGFVSTGVLRAIGDDISNADPRLKVGA